MLTVFSGAVQSSPTGPPLDADGDGTPGGDCGVQFHRLFGDTNPVAQSGNDFTAILAGNDNLAFRGAFNKPAGGGYLPYMDSNGDGNINSGDNLAFRTRFNKNLTWTV